MRWQDEIGDTIRLRVTPKAKRNAITPDRDEDGALFLRIAITTVPEDGKANKAVIALLAKHLSCPKSALTLIRGEKGRDKLVRMVR